MRILPYRTADGAIQGAVLELTRAAVTARASSAGELGELATELLSSLPQALMLLDEQLRVFWANREFLRRFKPQDNLFGQPLEKLWDGRSQDPELWSLLEDVASGGKSFSNVRVERPFAASGSGPMIFSARRIPATADRPLLTLVVMTPEAESHEAGDRGTA
jgi:nitrogen-specific signal transduction histidine kinase